MFEGPVISAPSTYFYSLYAWLAVANLNCCTKTINHFILEYGTVPTYRTVPYKYRTVYWVRYRTGQLLIDVRPHLNTFPVVIKGDLYVYKFSQKTAYILGVVFWGKPLRMYTEWIIFYPIFILSKILNLYTYSVDFSLPIHPVYIQGFTPVCMNSRHLFIRGLLIEGFRNRVTEIKIE